MIEDILWHEPAREAAQAQISLRGTVRCSAGPTLRSCWPSRAVAPLLSAAISMSAPAADIVPPFLAQTIDVRDLRSPADLNG